MKKSLILLSIISLFVVSSPDRAHSGAREQIMLPKPAMTGGMPLMNALAKRQSSRSFTDRALSDQVLSNLLWAADGVNRTDSGKRTAPSAMNKQEIDIYAALAEGLYRYDAKKHALELVLDRDIRAQTGQQDFVARAALNLVYVADLSAAAGADREEKVLYAAADTGFIGQNVYLFCASEGLATVIRGYIDRKALGKAMKLKSGQMIILAQTVGHPGK